MLTLGVSHKYRFSYVMYHNYSNKMPPLPTSPYYMGHFQIFHKMNIFLKNCFKYPWQQKKGKCLKDHLKETRNSFKRWPLNLWWISNKTIIEVGNNTNAATFKSFLHKSYKNTKLLFLWQCFLIFSWCKH